MGNASVTAKQEIVLRCGEASITPRVEGRIMIREPTS